ncbi:MAG: IS4 family transposase [Gammaproteobacteria bacterium]|nr:IS4 family transposase [Gammaproteobacteria bacterium]
MGNFWSPVQRVIEDVCASFDAKWQTRKRVIDTLFLVLFIFKLVLSKNQQGYKSVLNELWEQQALIHYQQHPLSSSSLCEARQKLPEEIFLDINKAVLFKRAETHALPTWHGHRVFAVDGSKVNLPHELLAVGYKAPNREQYYPQGVMSTVYHLESGLIYDCLLIKAGVSERHAVIRQMDMLSPGDVLVLDRGYFSYLVLYQAIEKNIHLVCRLQFGTMNKEIKSFFDSNLTETVIDYFPSESVKSEIKKQGFNLNYRKIKLRLIKYQINNEMYVCATTLIGNEYPVDEFPSVYHGRWGIEELYKISKEFINVEDMHSKTERGVKQELYAHVLLINIARIFEAEVNDQLPPPSIENQKKIR